MSQTRSTLRLVAVLAIGAVAACRPPGPPLAPGERPLTREPAVRVGIAVETAELDVGAPDRYEIIARDGRRVAHSDPDERWTFTNSGSDRLEARSTAGQRLGPLDAPVRVRAQDGSAPITIDETTYRGEVLIHAPAPGRLTAINVLELEAYLIGVVPLEIGVRPLEEIEVVKAQAVAARTYAIGHLGSREAKGFDFYATVEDQVYGGLEVEDPVTSRAVRETVGEIVTYQGAPILAYYHSTCGGRTAAIDEVWPRAPVPYLRSVSDQVEGTEDQYYCEISNRFRWTETWSGQALRVILEHTLATRRTPVHGIDRVERLEVEGRTPSGRARALQIVTDRESILVHGDSIRSVLRPDEGRILNSTLFVLDEERGDGVRATGGGWGHGVGMCQMGAVGRARAGQSYREILTTYYPGTTLQTLY